jgi:hypothetical protein
MFAHVLASDICAGRRIILEKHREFHGHLQNSATLILTYTNAD